MSTLIRMFWRLVTWPFVTCLILLAALRLVLVESYLWLRWGGEMISYRTSTKSIHDIYLLLEKKLYERSQVGGPPRTK